jgi:hypothetical protein
VKLIALRGGSDPEPMTDQDLADWGGVIDARSNVSTPGRKTPENVISAGEAALAVTNARRGRS